MSDAALAPNEIDQFLAARKVVVGLLKWVSDGNGAQRAVFPLMIAGELLGPTLELKHYQSHPTKSFGIMISVPPVICRLDFDYGMHVNTDVDEQGGMIYVIRQPHYHSWRDNKRFAIASSLPKKLPNARIISEKIRKLDQALRWFCGENNIELPSNLSIDPPETGLLV